MGRPALAVLVVIGGDSDVVCHNLNISNGHADVALLAAGATLGGLRDLRCRGGGRCRLVRRCRLDGGSDLGSLSLAGSGVAGLSLRVDDVGRRVVVDGCRLSSSSCRSSLRLLLDRRSASSVGRCSRSLLGRLGRSVDIRGVDATRQNSTDIDALLLLNKDLALVGRALEVSGIALILDALALGLPELAASVTSDGSRVEALIRLLPALLGGCPAALLGGIVGDFGAAPVGILSEAASGLLALSLSGLARGGGLSGLGGELCKLRARHLVGGGVLVVDVEAGAGLAVVDVSGNRDSGLGDKVTVAFEEDLGAASVKLRLVGVCGVQGKKLGASEVVAAL